MINKGSQLSRILNNVEINEERLLEIGERLIGGLTQKAKLGFNEIRYRENFNLKEFHFLKNKFNEWEYNFQYDKDENKYILSFEVNFEEDFVVQVV